MDLIVDANILFAGLIKESTTARLLFNPTLRLYSPEFVMEEFMKYSDTIQKKKKLKKKGDKCEIDADSDHPVHEKYAKEEAWKEG